MISATFKYFIKISISLFITIHVGKDKLRVEETKMVTVANLDSRDTGDSRAILSAFQFVQLFS